MSNSRKKKILYLLLYLNIFFSIYFSLYFRFYGAFEQIQIQKELKWPKPAYPENDHKLKSDWADKCF